MIMMVVFILVFGVPVVYGVFWVGRTVWGERDHWKGHGKPQQPFESHDPTRGWADF